MQNSNNIKIFDLSALRELTGGVSSKKDLNQDVADVLRLLPTSTIEVIAPKIRDLSHLVSICKEEKLDLSKLLLAFQKRGWKANDLAGYVAFFKNISSFDRVVHDLGSLAKAGGKLSFSEAVGRIRLILPFLDDLDEDQLDEIDFKFIRGLFKQRQWLARKVDLEPSKMLLCLKGFDQMHAFVMREVVTQANFLTEKMSTQLVGGYLRLEERYAIRHPGLVWPALHRIRKGDARQWASFLESAGEKKQGRLMRWMVALKERRDLPPLKPYLPPQTKALVDWFKEELPYILLGPELYQGKVDLKKRILTHWVKSRVVDGTKVFEAFGKEWNTLWMDSVNEARIHALHWMVLSSERYQTLYIDDKVGKREKDNARETADEWGCIVEAFCIDGQKLWEASYSVTSWVREKQSESDENLRKQIVENHLKRRDSFKVDEKSKSLLKMLYSPIGNKRIQSFNSSSSSSSSSQINRTQSWPNQKEFSK